MKSHVAAVAVLVLVLVAQIMGKSEKSSVEPELGEWIESHCFAVEKTAPKLDGLPGDAEVVRYLQIHCAVNKPTRDLQNFDGPALKSASGQ